jgi:hypothetical protein
MKILLKGDYSSNILSNSVINAQSIELYNPQNKNKICFGKLHISVSDSELVADSIKYSTLIDDEQFFAKSQFRQTIYRFDIPQIKIIGLDCRSLLSGNSYIAGNIKIFDLFADILVNMDKPYDINSPRPLMPNELLASIKKIVKIDSLIIINGRLRYCERYVVKEKPGVISIDNINVSVSGIANDSVKPQNTVIRGNGLFMNSGTMKVLMAIPLTSKDFSLQYSGSIGSIDITCLNAFIEAGEHRRIKSGDVKSAVFDINVKSGIAIGTVRAEYKDLSIAVLNKNTGSEKGFLDRISSLYGNLFVTRGSNMPDEKGLIKVGQINYKKNLNDYFFQFIWFALRGGIGNLVGF